MSDLIICLLALLFYIAIFACVTFIFTLFLPVWAAVIVTILILKF